MVPPPSDESAVVLLASEGFDWPQEGCEWWLVESPWHYSGGVYDSNAITDKAPELAPDYVFERGAIPGGTPLE